MIAADSPLRDPTFRRLFAAQLFSLTGTGLTTIALALLAWRLATTDADVGSAGAILGTALAIKMVAYLGIAPLVGAYAHRHRFVIDEHHLRWPQ